MKMREGEKKILQIAKLQRVKKKLREKENKRQRKEKKTQSKVSSQL